MLNFEWRTSFYSVFMNGAGNVCRKEWVVLAGKGAEGRPDRRGWQRVGFLDLYIVDNVYLYGNESIEGNFLKWRH
jgi:hypothetical protein